MRHRLIEKAEETYLKKDLPEICVGDSIVVSLRVKEGANKERIQKMKGLVIAEAGQGLSRTITVRKISSGVGVERVFPIHSPFVKEIEILSTGAEVRRAKLYYMRNRKGKKARIKYQEA